MTMYGFLNLANLWLERYQIRSFKDELLVGFDLRTFKYQIAANFAQNHDIFQHISRG